MKTKKTIKIGILFFIIFGLISCKTYFIPVDSFIEQFNGIDSTKLKTVYTKCPTGETISYLANPIKYIKCVDKENNPFELKNSPSIEIRFTQNNNKKTVFYFDYIHIKDSMVIGDKSRIFYVERSISLNDIKKIEVQDGHKKFKYVDKQKK